MEDYSPTSNGKENDEKSDIYVFSAAYLLELYIWKWHLPWILTSFLMLFESDYGGIFSAADKELQNLVRELDQDHIIKNTANRGIIWHSNPPSSPHFEGALKIMIKAAKHAFESHPENADEELMTSIIEAESLLKTFDVSNSK